MNIENCMIEGLKSASLDFTNNYQKVDLDYLNSKFRHNDEDNFLHSKGITFREKVESLYVTGTELYCYPELAAKLREVTDYPILKRMYPLDKTLKGIAFIRNFAYRIEEAYQDFQATLSATNKQVNALFNLYGAKRYAPVITEHSHDIMGPDYLTISGVKWQLRERNYDLYDEPMHTIDLYRLLNVKYGELYAICFEEFKPNSSYLALRLRKTCQHKGHVVWYDLNTGAKIDKPKKTTAAR
jgi:hypothetical protein